MAKVPKKFKEPADKAAKAERVDIGHRPSYPLDFFLWLDSPDIDGLVNALADEIDATASRRKRDKDTEEKFRSSVKILLLNLLMLRKIPLHTVLAVPLGAGAYSQKNRYSQPLASYRVFKAAYEGMRELGYIRVVTAGYWDGEKQKGKVTRIDSTNKLANMLDTAFPDDIVIFARHPNEESIRQKDEGKELMDYDDGDCGGYPAQARRNLERINACLNRHWYDLDMSEEEFDELYNEMVERHKQKRKNPPSINFTYRSLYRIYNNGDADAPEENFKQGGRFYGGWWESLPSEYRPFITINGKPTVEVDYANLHPQMLYALEGLQMEGDAYVVEGISRDVGKLAFQKLINGTGRIRVPDEFNAEEVGMAWKDVMETFRERHAPINKYFDTGCGTFLQFKDSEIVEKILLHFAGGDTPCLPVHDSLIVHHDLKDELKEKMLEEYSKAMGNGIRLKEQQNGYELFIERYREQGEDTRTIEEILEGMEKSQYERRLRAWYNYRDKVSI